MGCGWVIGCCFFCYEVSERVEMWKGRGGNGEIVVGSVWYDSVRERAGLDCRSLLQSLPFYFFFFRHPFILPV